MHPNTLHGQPRCMGHVLLRSQSVDSLPTSLAFVGSGVKVSSVDVVAQATVVASVSCLELGLVFDHGLNFLEELCVPPDRSVVLKTISTVLIYSGDIFVLGVLKQMATDDSH